MSAEERYRIAVFETPHVVVPREVIEQAEAALQLAVDRVEGEMIVEALPMGNSIRPRYLAALAALKAVLK